MLRCGSSKRRSGTSQTASPAFGADSPKPTPGSEGPGPRSAATSSTGTACGDDAVEIPAVGDAGREIEAAEAFEWIAERSPTAAVRWHAGLFTKIETLRRFPRGFPVAAESRAFDREIRQLVYGSYRVLFEIDGSVVRILHIRHGARRRLGEEE